MKHIHKKIVICAALATAPCLMGMSAYAQTEAEADDSVYMVKTAFRSVAQNDLLGGVSVVNVEEMLKNNYTTYTLDNMESLVGGWNGKSIWGMDDDFDQGYLVLIDGVPRDANNVMPSEIAQISFIKGANALALYGSRGAKGVILITTKRGAKSDELQIDLNINTGFHVIKELPKYLDAAEYMEYNNLACDNDGKKHNYADDLIEKTRSGVNPYHYVDIDYYSSDYIKKVKNRSEAVLEMNGGNNRARLYGNINASTENDFVKFGDAKKNHTNRLSVRGNVDMNFNDFISGHIDANATFYDSKHMQYNSDPSKNATYWSVAATELPNDPKDAAPLIPIDMLAEDCQGAELIENTNNIYDGCFLGGTTSKTSNLISQVYAGGELTFTSRQFQFDGGLDFNLEKLLDGLSMHTNFGMDYKTSYNVHFDPQYAVFVPKKWSEDEKIIQLAQQGTDEVTGKKKLWGTKDTRTLALSFSLNYDKSFGDNNVSAMVVGNGFQQTKDGEYHNTTNANLGFNVNYNFAHRYYVDATASIVHSAKLAEGHRNEVSPSLTLGWNLAKESFLDGSIFDDLLLSASVSQLSEDIDVAFITYPNGQPQTNRYYLYNGNWDKNQWGYSWGDGKSATTIGPKRGENPNLEMIKRKEFSANLKFSMFEHFLTGDVTYFQNKMTGYIINTTEDWPEYMQNFIPYLNNDEKGRKGFDFALNINDQFNEDLFMSLGLVGTYYDTKVLKMKQTTLDKENQSQLDKEGRPIDAIWGYKNLGFFQTAEEVDFENSGLPKQSGTIRPGDLRYADLSNNGEGDGTINGDDKVYLGKSGKFGSPFVFGVNLTVKYKNLSLFVAGMAECGAYASIMNVNNSNSYYQPKEKDKYSEIVKDTWTPENPNAKYPALTTSASANNYAESDFWYYKNNAFRLTKVQLSYELPKEMLGDSFVKGLGAFVSGKDLLTIAKERKIMETAIGREPYTRFFNIGIKATF